MTLRIDAMRVVIVTLALVIVTLDQGSSVASALPMPLTDAGGPITDPISESPPPLEGDSSQPLAPAAAVAGVIGGLDPASAALPPVSELGNLSQQALQDLLQQQTQIEW